MKAIPAATLVLAVSWRLLAADKPLREPSGARLGDPRAFPAETPARKDALCAEP